MQLTDTHCHIHEADQAHLGSGATRARWAKAEDPNPDHMVARAAEAGVARLLCVGTTLADSAEAIEFAARHPQVWATIGIHPHEAGATMADSTAVKTFQSLATKPKVVAIGECGLDYYYDHSPKEAQIRCLEMQMQLALEHNLPMVFHVRDAFADFWPIFDAHPGIRGAVHCFTASKTELDQCLARGLYVGLNGIMTFTTQSAQLEAAKAVPLDHLLLETDAPFLTPAPYRAIMNEPKYVRNIAEFLANLRGEALEMLADATTTNARTLFGI
ncbi:MAG TPA: TatD family hydrolase [Candidatus Saccharimonadales bacterium]|nr:TatD family hydrolase [Candidatus Saccharimonadales bacterium]